MHLSSILQWKINIFLYLTFGWRIARIFIFSIGRLYFYFNKGEKKIIKNSVFEVIGTMNREADIKNVTKKIYDGIFSHYYEKLFIAFEGIEKATMFLNRSIISNDLEVLRRTLSKGKGVVFITGHYGAIEYIPTLLAVNNFAVSMIAKFKTEQLRKQVFSQAKKYSIRLIDAENDGNVLRSAFKELRENRILITQCDEIEEWRPSEKEKTSFLGHVTGVDRTIDIIQKRTGAEVVFGIIHRYSLKKYKLILFAYEDMSQILNDISLSSVGETVLKFLEQFIYYYPEQWYQWKKFAEIKTITASGLKIEGQISFPFFKPAFGKIL